MNQSQELHPLHNTNSECNWLVKNTAYDNNVETH